MEALTTFPQCNFCDNLAVHAVIVVEITEVYTLDNDGELQDYVRQCSEEVDYGRLEYLCQEHSQAHSIV